MVLREAGHSVRIVDPCESRVFRVGESLPAACGRLLSRLGLGSVESLLGESAQQPCVAHESAWGSLDWERRDALESPEGGGWHIDRVHFDQTLQAAAIDRGVTITKGSVATVRRREDSRTGGFDLAIAAESSDDGFDGTLSSRWLVDGSGRSSRCGRALGSRRERLSDQMALVRWFKSPEQDRDQATRLVATQDGWWYSARLPHGFRVVALHCLSEDVPRFSGDSETFARACDGTGLLSYSLMDSVPVGDFVVRDAGMSRLVAPAGLGWLAVGDAAIGFDPLASQGLLFALYSGVRGAEAILSSVGNENDFAGYVQRVERVFTANQESRMLHYASVARFSRYAYWRKAMGLEPLTETIVDESLRVCCS